MGSPSASPAVFYKSVGRFVLPSAVPIILFALVFFVLLAVAGVVLLSLALRYRAGTARRQGRRWVASLNVWMTSLSAVLFLSFSFLISFWLGTAFRFALIGMGFGAIVGLLSLAMTRWESQPEGLFYTPSRWLALDAGSCLPFRTESFDAVFSNDSINHLPDRSAVLHDWHRLLRPGGRVLFTDPIVVTGQLSNEEIRTRSSIGFFLFTPVGY